MSDKIRYLIILCVMLLGFVPQISSQTLTARSVFENLHSPAFETLKKTTRLDMLDYWDADSIYHARNATGAESWIEKLTPDYAYLRLTPVSTCEIKVLPLKNDTVVMSIYTVGDNKGVADSEVSFYDKNLKELPATKFFTRPQVSDFIDIKGLKYSPGEIDDIIKIPSMVFVSTSGDNRLKGNLAIETTIDVDVWKEISSHIRKDIVLNWQNGMFRLEKPKKK